MEFHKDDNWHSFLSALSNPLSVWNNCVYDTEAFLPLNYIIYSDGSHSKKWNVNIFTLTTSLSSDLSFSLSLSLPLPPPLATDINSHTVSLVMSWQLLSNQFPYPPYCLRYFNHRVSFFTTLKLNAAEARDSDNGVINFCLNITAFNVIHIFKVQRYNFNFYWSKFDWVRLV